MTEEEAKTKWCPFARTLGTLSVQVHGIETVVANGPHNRGFAMDGPLTKCLCIASACMAFRWLPDIHIPLGGGHVAIVSPADAGFESGGYWWSGRYAKNDLGYLHRHIAEAIWGPLPKGMFVDHIDGDPLNNRRANLRLVTPSENAANAAARGGKSKYRGVFQARAKWAAQIAKAGVRIHLGTFDTEEEAARAYDAAAADIHGSFARLNLTSRSSGREGYCGLAGAPQ